MVLCAAGYFCKTGASSRYPEKDITRASDFGPCEPGYYCPEGTQTPIPCPAGTFSPQARATNEYFCIPCPPGYVCPGTGNVLPKEKCEAGKYCSDGLVQNICG